jgi:polyphosphate kinase
LKTHTKVTLVVRQETEGLRTYTHVASGNYNAETATLYTDLGLFTCRPEIGADATQLFNLLTGFAGDPTFGRLLVAPFNMRRRFVEMIDREVEHQRAGRGGAITAKMNSLEDPKIVRALYRASQEGVKVDLVVRGVCRLRPGVPGLSENIRVLSIVGRFLEHARIFAFGNGGEPEVYFGSADWMSRNLDFRVEAIAPIEEPALRDEVRAILDLQLADNRAWELGSDGAWKRRAPAAGEPERSSQRLLMERALARAARTTQGA